MRRTFASAQLRILPEIGFFVFSTFSAPRTEPPKHTSPQLSRKTVYQYEKPQLSPPPQKITYIEVKNAACCNDSSPLDE